MYFRNEPATDRRTVNRFLRSAAAAPMVSLARPEGLQGNRTGENQSPGRPQPGDAKRNEHGSFRNDTSNRREFQHEYGQMRLLCAGLLLGLRWIANARKMIGFQEPFAFKDGSYGQAQAAG